jgi:hypothetical protein
MYQLISLVFVAGINGGFLSCGIKLFCKFLLVIQLNICIPSSNKAIEFIL